MSKRLSGLSGPAGGPADISNHDGGHAGRPARSGVTRGAGPVSARRKVGAKPAARPLYMQVKEHLIRRVLAGDWRPGACLPSELKLAQEYGLSQGTVRRAIEEMAIDGLVVRQAGCGTFVASHKGNYKPFRFSRFISDSGVGIADCKVTYISSTRARADKRVAAGLRIRAGDGVAKIVRVRHYHGHPVLLDSIFLGAGLCPGAERIIADRKPDSIYLSLEQAYNLLIVRVDESVWSREATPQEVELLELATGTPVLEVERIAYSLGGEPIEWRISVCHTGQLHYVNRAT